MASNYKHLVKTDSPLSKLLFFDCLNDSRNKVFNFSKYINGQPGLGKSLARKDFKSDISALFKDLEKTIRALRVKQELAIHSQVLVDGIPFHIPLIDLSKPPATYETQFSQLSSLQEKYNADIYLFNSGRSYHAYFDCLLTEAEWVKFLGDCLLLNKKDQSDLIDTRWIGHSLLNGYSSLRLSCNTAHYLSYPVFSTKLSKHPN